MTAILDIVSIECINQQEEGYGGDEIYFRIRDISGDVLIPEYWTSDAPINFLPGDILVTDPLWAAFEFTGEARVEMWESDGALTPQGNVSIADDDLIQAFTVNEFNANYDFWESPDTFYNVQYEVVPVIWF